jgi:hypothetical protein
MASGLFLCRLTRNPGRTVETTPDRSFWIGAIAGDRENLPVCGCFTQSSGLPIFLDLSDQPITFSG